MEIILVLLIAAAGVAAVILPAIRGGAARQRPAPVRVRFRDNAALDAEVERYRAALRAGTVCARCRFANPSESRFCADCGRPLASEA